MLVFGFGLFAGGVSLFIGSILVFVIGAIIFAAFCGVPGWNHNHQTPRLTVSAKIIHKRCTTQYPIVYYITFFTEKGHRLELPVSEQEYGLLPEGADGTLTYQGTRFLAFQQK